MDTLGWIILTAAWVVIIASFFYAIRPVLQELYDREQKRRKAVKRLFYGYDASFPEFKRELRTARTVAASGVSLRYMAGECEEILEKRVREDKFRLVGVVMHPEVVESMDQRALQEYWEIHKHELLKEIDDTKKVFQKLKGIAEEMGDSDAVQLYGIKTAPHLGIAMIDLGESNAMIRIHLYSTYGLGVRHSVIIAHREVDEQAFEYFRATYERIKSASITDRIV